MAVPAQQLFGQFPAFLVTGAFATASHWGLMALLIHHGFIPLLATAAGASLGLVLAYLGHYYITFAATGRHRDKLPLFMLMASIGWLVNLLVFFSLSSTVLSVLWAQLFATACATFCNYIISRLFVFNPPASARDQQS